MVRTIGIAIAKAWPLENRTICNPTFKKSGFQMGRFQIPTIPPGKNMLFTMLEFDFKQFWLLQKFQQKNFFFTCGTSWTQVCSHIIGYIPVPIGLLFAIAPTHDWNGNGATQTCTFCLLPSPSYVELCDVNFAIISIPLESFSLRCISCTPIIVLGFSLINSWHWFTNSFFFLHQLVLLHSV